jgi:NitT/TauT family transport system ATP-binding protein
MTLTSPASTIERPKGARLAVESVDFVYPDGREVFRAFSLHAKPGEFVAVLGPSGCGKTTLLNLLAGFLAPTRGALTIDGAPVAPEHPALGFVFQTPNLFSWLTAIENVRFGLRMQRTLSAEAQRASARDFLALVGLETLADALPHKLSGGQRQRVALARSLALEPRLLLMDEPFAALDAITRATMNDELLRLWSALGQTILFITHDIDEAVYLADRVLVLGLPPSGIQSEIVIDLPRPRDRLKTRTSPRFAEYVDLLTRRIGDAMAAGRPASPTSSRSRFNERTLP